MTPEPNSVQRLFDEVAEACERCLEASHGREVGMSFAGVMRVVARLGTNTGDEGDPETLRLVERLDQLLHGLSTGYLHQRCVEGRVGGDDRPSQPLQPASMVTNMIYDPEGREIKPWTPARRGT